MITILDLKHAIRGFYDEGQFCIILENDARKENENLLNPTYISTDGP